MLDAFSCDCIFCGIPTLEEVSDGVIYTPRDHPKREGLEAGKIRRLSGLLSVMLRNWPIQMVSGAGDAR